MHIAYRVGWPCWKLAAKSGIPLFIRGSVIWDNEAHVFVAQSEDFLPEFCCVAESESLEGLKQELLYILEEALEHTLGPRKKTPDIHPVLRLAI